MKFVSSLNFLYFVVFSAMIGCAEDNNYQYLNQIIAKDDIAIYYPYKQKKLTRVCIVNSGASLVKFVRLDRNVPYGKDAILEIFDTGFDLELIVEGKIRHEFILNEGSAYCTNKPEKLALEKYKDHWIMVEKGS